MTKTNITFNFTNKPTTENFISFALESLQTRTRSAWDRGVNKYAIELLTENIAYYEYFEDIANINLLNKAMLNGASNWNQYSWGGSSLIFDTDIAERLCNPTEYTRTHGGHTRPNKREEWLDVQERALYQASNRIINAFKLYVSEYNEEV